MNSPTEPVSPSPSTPSSGSPPPEDLVDQLTTAPGLSVPSSSQHSTSPTQTKRRLPLSSVHNRDLKSRKRDDGKRSLASGADGREAILRKDELLDVKLVEELRQEFGDPFDETPLKRSSYSM